MNKFEEKARELKKEGYSCSYAVYTVFIEELHLKGDYPAPRSIEGKCGALLAALKILEETNNADKIEEFETEFVKEFDFNKCVDLMTHDRRCNDYVGWSVNKICELLAIC